MSWVTFSLSKWGVVPDGLCLDVNIFLGAKPSGGGCIHVHRGEKDDTSARQSTVASFALYIDKHESPAGECHVRTCLFRTNARSYCDAESLELTNAELYLNATATSRFNEITFSA